MRSAAYIFVLSVIFSSCSFTREDQIRLNRDRALANKYEEVAGWADILALKDEFDSSISYKHVAFLGSYYDSPLRFSIIKDKSGKHLNLGVVFEGVSWIFFDRVVILSGTEKKEYNFAQSDVYRHAEGRSVLESAAVDISPREIPFFKKFLSADKIVRLRFSGERISDHDISKEDLVAIQKIIDFYENLR